MTGEAGKLGARVHVTRTHIVYHPQTLLLCPETERDAKGGNAGWGGEGRREEQFLHYVKWMDNTLYRLSRAGITAVNMKRKFRQWPSGRDGWVYASDASPVTNNLKSL